VNKALLVRLVVLWAAAKDKKYHVAVVAIMSSMATREKQEMPTTEVISIWLRRMISTA
jgi:hypothetical protein